MPQIQQSYPDFDTYPTEMKYKLLQDYGIREESIQKILGEPIPPRAEDGEYLSPDGMDNFYPGSLFDFEKTDIGNFYRQRRYDSRDPLKDMHDGAINLAMYDPGLDYEQIAGYLTGHKGWSNFNYENFYDIANRIISEHEPDPTIADAKDRVAKGFRFLGDQDKEAGFWKQRIDDIKDDPREGGEDWQKGGT